MNVQKNTAELSDNELLAMMYTILGEAERQESLLIELKAEAEKRGLL